jgi:arylformamidase
VPGALRERMRMRAAGSGDADGSHGVLARGPFPLPPGATVERDVAYGEHPAMRLDVYRPAEPDALAARPGVPAVVLVHGGGWLHGAKDLHRMVRHKVAHWVGRGAVVVSVGYRLLPEADPLAQAQDVARALAFVQRQAPSWGADATAVVLAGHSSGAHLVSLLAADPAIGAAHGAAPWCASLVLDSAAFDVELLMQRVHLPLHDAAFGTDPAAWRRVSPRHRLAAALQAPMLLVCSSRRPLACAQAEAFAATARELGGRVEVLPVDLSHGDLNDQLGRPGAYTDAVDAFLRSAGLVLPLAAGGKPPSGRSGGHF